MGYFDDLEQELDAVARATARLEPSVEGSAPTRWRRPLLQVAAVLVVLGIGGFVLGRALDRGGEADHDKVTSLAVEYQLVPGAGGRALQVDVPSGPPSGTQKLVLVVNGVRTELEVQDGAICCGSVTLVEQEGTLHVQVIAEGANGRVIATSPVEQLTS